MVDKNKKYKQLKTINYHQALVQEANYWGEEAEKAAAAGIPFIADQQRAVRLKVFRGKGLPQLQSYDPAAERLMNGKWYNQLFAAVGAIAQPAEVLVLACGAGGLCLELARQGHRVTGIDISERALRLARDFADQCRQTEGPIDVTYRCADLNTIVLPAGHYDAIVAWDGLHHIVQLPRLMRQIAGALRRGGEMIYSDTDGQPLANRLLGGVLYFMLPTHVSYREKLRIAFYGIDHIQVEMRNRSPFEGVAEGNLFRLTVQHFQLIEKRQHTAIGFRSAIVGDLRVRNKYRQLLIRLLKRMDEFLVECGWLRGDHLFVRARPKS